MLHTSQYATKIVVKDANGNDVSVYDAAQFVTEAIEVTNGHATTTITPGMAVIIDTTAANITGFIPRWGATVRVNPVKLSVIPCTAAANTGMVGVAIDNIYPGKSGRVAVGGFVTALCITGTCTTVGHALLGTTSTAGSVTSSSAPAIGTSLGTIIVAAGTGAGATGSATEVFIRLGYTAA